MENVKQLVEAKWVVKGQYFDDKGEQHTSEVILTVFTKDRKFEIKPINTGGIPGNILSETHSIDNAPEVYSRIDAYLKAVMVALEEFKK